MRAPLLLALPLAACTTAPPRIAVAPAAVEVTGPAVANPPVGGADLPTGNTLIANLGVSPVLSTYSRLLAATGQVPDSVTVFAPTEEAFGRLAPGTVEALLRPENRMTLTKLVTLHMVTGRLTSAALVRQVAAGGGQASLTSVAGEPLMLSLTGSVVTLTDSGGNRSYVEIADVRERNGVIHVVNGVLVPRL